MDYTKLMKSLTKEMKVGAQYDRLAPLCRVLLIIAMIPLIVAFVLSKFAYSVSLFFYKAISSPAEHLHIWLKSQKDEVHHATQAIMYFVCMPFIFSLQVLLSLNTVYFFFQWFFLMIQGYLLTLGGIKWQPIVTEATFEDDEEYDVAPDETFVALFAIAAFASFVFPIVFFWLASVLPKLSSALSGIGVFFVIVYLVLVYIINPIFFKRVPKEQDEE